MATILNVDDSKSFRELVLATLATANFTVIQKIDGEEALAWAKANNNVDLVLSDLNMPKLDGIALIAELRKLPSYQYLPMLLLTTETSPQKRLAAKAARVTGWIAKPFDSEKLIKTLHQVLGEL